MSHIKVLSLTQPWASLVAIGAKRYETRSWRTQWPGFPLAIHAAKGFPSQAKKFAELQCGTLQQGGYVDQQDIFDVNRLERGAIIAVCWLAACYRTEDIRDRLTKQELAFGDYSDGRWAWELTDVRRLTTPIPARGALGLWEHEWDNVAY